METLAWLWCHAFQIITRFSQQFVKHALGCIDHTLVCLASDIASLETIGKWTSAFMEPESLCQFIENSTIRVHLIRHSRGICRSFLRYLYRVIPHIERISLQIEVSNSRFKWNSHCNSPVAVASNVQSQNRAWKQMCLENSGRLFAGFRTLSCTRVLPEIQLRQVQQRSVMSMRTVTCQRVRLQLNVRN